MSFGGDEHPAQNQRAPRGGPRQPLHQRPSRIEDYGVIGNLRSAALVSRWGSIDWLCFPRFDSGACFASLLGDARNGHWSLQPAGDGPLTCRRRYRDGTLVLETELETGSGVVRVIDCMPPDRDPPTVIRVVEGVRGTVRMEMELVIRFDYGWIVPWVRTIDGVLHAVGGPDAISLRTPIAHHGENLTTVAEFDVGQGDRVPFVLSWHPSHEPAPPSLDADQEIAAAEDWWRRWASQNTYSGPWQDAVLRSLITLKALTYAPTGGIIASATTSLPEWIGGVRNWDYRYVWLRDATFTLDAFLATGFRQEACAWRDWLLRTVAGAPKQLQLMYGVAGERRLPELTLDWLPGYEASRPVRIGNGAASQLQLDIYGELMDVLHEGRRAGIDSDPFAWSMQRNLLEHLETQWKEPDEGLWEVRQGREHFTHSKMMAWVAFDRAVRAVEGFGVEGPVARWRAIRDTIHSEVCAKGFDAQKGAFTRAYGSPELDAAILMMPLVGFLPANDPRMISTVAAIERELLQDGLVLRYLTHPGADGLPPGEGTFLLCSFWLADNYALAGRRAEAERLLERLLSLRNDLGLLSEEYDTAAGRLLGNFPQAYSHVGLINTVLHVTSWQPAPMRAPAAKPSR